MKYCLWILSLFVLLNLECKKRNSTPYAGIFHIRVPLLEPSVQDTWFGSASYQDLNINRNREAWKFIPAEGKGYYIQSDSTSLRITEEYNAAYMTGDTTVDPDLQIFRIVPSPGNPNLVALQSYTSGKFIQVNYCYYQGQTWGYGTPITDSSGCGAYGSIALSNVADTCYCVNRFLLEK